MAKTFKTPVKQQSRKPEIFERNLKLPIRVAVFFLPQKKNVFWASKRRFPDPLFWVPGRNWRAPPPKICLPRGPEVWGGDLGRQPCSPFVERIADGNGVRLPVIYVDGIEGQSNAVKQCRASPAECNDIYFILFGAGWILAERRKQ